MLGIGAAILGSAHVIGIDIDADALQIAQDNCDQFEDLQVSHIRHQYSNACCQMENFKKKKKTSHKMPCLQLSGDISALNRTYRCLCQASPESLFDHQAYLA